MRIVSPAPFTPIDGCPLPTWAGRHGERLTIRALADDIIRVQFLPEGRERLDRTWLIVGEGGDVPREGRRRAEIAPLAPLQAEVRWSGAGATLATACLAVELDAATGALRWSDAAGRPFAADLSGRAYSYDRAGTGVFHYLQRQAGERYYGFGERAGPLNKAGMRMRMQNVDALGYDAQSGDPLYKHFPFYITLVPELNLAYGLLYDNLASCTYDMGREVDAYHGAYRYYQADGGDVDYYLIFGPTIAEVVAKLARLTGLPALPPRWSLGYLGSTMTYTELPDAQQQLQNFIRLCDEHDIPCDMFHLSSGYSSGNDNLRYVFEWNREKIADPAALAEQFHRANIRLAANIKPCLLTSHPRYREVAERGGFIRAADADQPEVSAFWDGAGSYIDFTSAAGYAWWQERLRDALLQNGIDAAWNDNNEFEIWDDEARCNGFGRPLPIGLARPIQTLLMGRASFEALRAFRPHQRPFVISRSGCPGIQRYAQTWSGDNQTSWEALRYNIPMGLGLSLSGAPNTGHDVGGFYGYKPDPELFVRWVQNGIFHPRFTIHSWHLDGTVNEPWMYPEVLPLIRSAIRLRYRLIPYLYTLLFGAAQTGAPIIRPLVYAFQDDPRCQEESFDFMLGPGLLVASVLEPGARTRTVYLPRGDWYDFHTGLRYEGGQEVIVDAPLERCPLLAPAGGIIPLGKPMRHVGAEEDDLREVLVFPHPDQGEATFTLVEDDGVSMDYLDGAVTCVTLRVAATASRLELAAEARGGYPLPYNQISFVLPPGEVRAAYGGAERRDCHGRRVIDLSVEVMQ